MAHTRKISTQNFLWNLLFSVSLGHAYVEYATLPWKPEQYPHPDLDARTCRTEYHRFCDPDQVLFESEIRTIEQYLRKDRRVECNQDLYEVQLGVAIVKQVSKSRSFERHESVGLTKKLDFIVKKRRWR